MESVEEKFIEIMSFKEVDLVVLYHKLESLAAVASLLVEEEA